MTKSIFNGILTVKLILAAFIIVFIVDTGYGVNITNTTFTENANLSINDTFYVPKWQWVYVIEPIMDFERGESCGIQYGGSVTILEFSPDNERALLIYSSPGDGFGTRCPSGAQFYLSTEELNSFNKSSTQTTGNDNLFVNNTPPLNDTLWVNNISYVNGTLWVNGTPYINSTLWINGTPYVNGTLWINNISYVNSTLWINGTPYVNSTLWINNTPPKNKEEENTSFIGKILSSIVKFIGNLFG